eukprot:6351867-Alexandrium_andersonii.AAC.1
MLLYVLARILEPRPVRTLIVLTLLYVHARILMPSPLRTLTVVMLLYLRCLLYTSPSPRD